MKKFGKIVTGLAAAAAVSAGAYACYKKFVKKDTDESFDDFEDDLEEDDDEESREYVSINITSDDEKKEEEPAEATEE